MDVATLLPKRRNDSLRLAPARSDPGLEPKREVTMSYTGDVSRNLETVPFEGTQERQPDPPRNDRISGISAELPLIFAVVALFALYFVT